MRKQCVPGLLSLSMRRPGYEAMLLLYHIVGNVHVVQVFAFFDSHDVNIKKEVQTFKLPKILTRLNFDTWKEVYFDDGLLPLHHDCRNNFPRRFGTLSSSNSPVAIK